MKTVVLLSAVIFLSGCSALNKSASTQSNKGKQCGITKRDASNMGDARQVKLENNVLYYRGELSQKANAALFELYQNVKVKPRLLRINSQGGDAMLGLDLGEWIHENQLSVEVLGLCASSCANYVFPAGQEKLLNKNSVLLWHGGAYQYNLEEEAKLWGKASVQGLKLWQTREDAFFKRLGIDSKITIYGQTDDYLDQFPEHSGFDYSISDMKKMGLTGIRMNDGVWQWRKHYPAIKVYRVELPQG